MFKKVGSCAMTLALAVALLVYPIDVMGGVHGRMGRTDQRVISSASERSNRRGVRRNHRRKQVPSFSDKCVRVGGSLNRCQTVTKQRWIILSSPKNISKLLDSMNDMRSALLGTKIEEEEFLKLLGALIDWRENRFAEVSVLREYLNQKNTDGWNLNKLDEQNSNELLEYVNAFLQSLKSEKYVLNRSNSSIKGVKRRLSITRKNLRKLLKQVSNERHSEGLDALFEDLEDKKSRMREKFRNSRDACNGEFQNLCNLSANILKYEIVKKKSKM